ncbi:DEAD/DEAH box helicase [Corynebacterium sp. TAE3-ERU30]|uniref:DEAD/DEAH box helicase n=1 Tax=Corynebacterium sp. TAE3-ERU30 TaxID=2849496 RepID=UPI001C46A8B1|nr:DEAD/DEAH box helicase [Corynebacterium sp. TAE3-ERU30]MBV7282437.1 DEAD/DEAH box helicase [Corynebacterium sp. TAE3-ERU30]
MSSFGAELTTIISTALPTATPTFIGTRPSRPAAYQDWPDWVLPELRTHLEHEGITRPYAHQVECAEAVHAGRDTIISTGTSSGKSLGYLLPILSALASDDRACALYITPTKALGNDQLHTVARLCSTISALDDVAPHPYDGDTPIDARRPIRDASRFVFSTPDMLHASILAAHGSWTRLLRNLRYVVIDEAHVYRGMFGAHVALVLRRLRRLCAHYGGHPTFVLASATSRDPAAHASRLIDVPDFDITSVERDSAPAGEQTIMLLEPSLLPSEDERQPPQRRAASTEAADVMALLLAEGARTLTFVRSRHTAETVALRCAEELIHAGHRDYARRIASYRAGYTREDRHALERALDEGELLGVATTNALELGIDIGGIDAVVSAGFPGTVASMWQQAGRAGRRGQGSLYVLVARSDPMDTYLIRHPEALLERPLEEHVFDPTNPYVVSEHVLCAAAEKPLNLADIDALGAGQVLPQLVEDQLLRHRHGRYYPADPRQVDTIHSQVALRGNDGGEVLIVDSTDGRMLGTVDPARAQAQVFPGAVYLHQGESFVVDELDVAENLALVHPEQPPYSTFSRSSTTLRILAAPEEEALVNYAPGLWVANLEVEVTKQVVGYVKRYTNGQPLEEIPLEMSPQVLRTRAVSYTLDPAILQQLKVSAAEAPGALHAAEHAAIGILPLLATCDRWDIGGVSTMEHPDTGLPTVFVYDGHEGGAGFADTGFRRFPEWISATFEAVRSCPCAEGCPSCVQSPKCGNGNQPLDKDAAIAVLGAVVSMTGDAGD